MTYAPADLLAVQRYAHDRTGMPWDALGIIHGTPQGGGYHEGQDLLAAAGRAPGPRYPSSDYSYADARAVSSNGIGRDLAAADRLAGGDAASAFDFGDGFPGGYSAFLRFNAWMRGRLLANDPRARDIREMIHTLDGRTVRRIDRTGRQPDSGDSSHLSHTHFSFFRDSLGRRVGDDNFLGLLKEFFEGKALVANNAYNAEHYLYYLNLLKHDIDGLDGAGIVHSAFVDAIVEIRDGVKTLGNQSATVTLSDADRAAITQALAGAVPTAAEIATAVLDEQHRRDEA